MKGKPASPRVINKLLAEFSPKTFQTSLEPLLITRKVQSQGSQAARDFIVQTLEVLGWHVQLDEFTQDTVIGKKTFTNIVATYNKNSPRRLVVAAHYDTKITPKGFIGAVDSAVPCAMMLELAKSVDFFLSGRKGVKGKDPELTLQLIFFDGEEAFNHWSDTDSLYGSRWMADKLSTQSYKVESNLGFCQNGAATELDRIDSFILLDLIGAKNPSFMRYSMYNTNLFDAMLRLEKKLQLLDLNCGVGAVIKDQTAYQPIQDDQIPFQKAGVKNILHLIATPFPSQWHTIGDDETNLDYPTITYIQKLVMVYVIEYLSQ